MWVAIAPNETMRESQQRQQTNRQRMARLIKSTFESASTPPFELDRQTLADPYKETQFVAGAFPVDGGYRENMPGFTAVLLRKVRPGGDVGDLYAAFEHFSEGLVDVVLASEPPFAAVPADGAWGYYPIDFVAVPARKKWTKQVEGIDKEENRALFWAQSLTRLVKLPLPPDSLFQKPPMRGIEHMLANCGDGYHLVAVPTLDWLVYIGDNHTHRLALE